MSILFPSIKSPTCVSIELTTACNQKCRHCYNFWRHSSEPDSVIDIAAADRLIDDVIENGVFQVILTGGECLLNGRVLEHFMRRLSENGVAFTMNSNLLSATPEKMRRFADYGLPHVLTSLNCCRPEINDMMVSRRNAFGRIVAGIEATVAAGIRVSSNMIVTQRNKDHVYETGSFLHGLGVTNFFTTRMVPSHCADAEMEKELQLTPEEQKRLILDESVRVKEDTGINIGSLIQYPVCFLQDVFKYRDYVGRGCQAGKKLLTINANGDTHACVHESRKYGNALTDGIRACWENMQMWRDDSLLPVVCRECAWLPKCEGGCRTYTRNLADMDLLAPGPEGLPSPEALDSEFLDLVPEKTFLAPGRLRWRAEDGFYLVSVRGASVHTVDLEVARFLMQRQREATPFTLEDFPGSAAALASMLEKWIVETTDGSTREPVSGHITRVARPRDRAAAAKQG
ncbi:MAG: radical SAM protein [Pseudodesulfovibrio sp.]